MLIDFNVKNFLSFKDDLNFTMKATKGSKLADHLIEKNKIKYKKHSVLFGANAAGKTNFIKSIAFLKDIVLYGFENSKIEKKYFRLEDDYYNKDSEFNIEFTNHDQIYKYNLAFSYNEKIITKESLSTTIKNKDIYIFNRYIENNKIIVKTDYVFENDDDFNRFTIYSSDFENSQDKNINKTIFISDTAKRCPKTEYFKHYINVISWFLSLIIIFPDTKFASINQLLDSDERIDFLEIIKSFDLNINDMHNEKINFDDLFKNIEENEALEYKKEILNDLEEDSMMIKINNNIVRLEKEEDGTIETSKLILSHGNNKSFDLYEESDGTQRLFDLIPILLILKENRTILIDEIDRSLHTKIVKKFIEYFMKYNEESESQLIITSHDFNLIDLDLFRQDEIIFMDRKNDGSTSMKSLVDFSERLDRNVIKQYLLGQYGGVPNLRKLYIKKK